MIVFTFNIIPKCYVNHIIKFVSEFLGPLTDFNLLPPFHYKGPGEPLYGVELGHLQAPRTAQDLPLLPHPLRDDLRHLLPEVRPKRPPIGVKRLPQSLPVEGFIPVAGHWHLNCEDDFGFCGWGQGRWCSELPGGPAGRQREG